MNPELRRQLWLHVSTPRLIAFPLVLALLTTLAGVAYSWRPAEVSHALLIVGVLLSAGLGAAATADSMLSEVREKTWDWQRLSSLGPWQMTWGKLVGSATLPIYGSALCYAAFISLGGTSHASVAPVLVVMLALLLSALAQAGSLLAACSALFRSPRYAAGAGHVALALLTAFPVMSIVLSVANGPEQETLKWFGVKFSGTAAVAWSAAAFFGWALLGVYRTLRAQLQFRSVPWVWTSFVLFTAIYVAGFVPELPGRIWSERFVLRGLVADAVVLGWAYGAVLASPLDTMQLQRVLLRWEGAGLRRAASDIPPWVGTVVLAAFSTVATVVLAGQLKIDDTLPVSATCLGLFALLLRDSALVFLFRLLARGASMDVWVAVILACIHVVIPLILEESELPGWRALFSLYPAGGLVAAAVPLLQAALLFALARRFWRAYTRELAAA